MYLPEFGIGYELQGNDGHYYRILEDLNDYFVKAFDYDSQQEVTVNKELFATY